MIYYLWFLQNDFGATPKNVIRRYRGVRHTPWISGHKVYGMSFFFKSVLLELFSIFS
jgi:hypothetical protein